MGRSSSASTKKDPPLELQKKNQNVAAGLRIYEKARSRRERNRASLEAAALETVALGSPRQQNNTKKKRTIFQEDDEQEMRYREMGRRRVLGKGVSETSLDSLPPQICSAQSVKAKVAELKAQQRQEQHPRAAPGKSAASQKTATTTLPKPKPIARRSSSTSSTAKSRLKEKIDTRGKKMNKKC